MTKQRIIRLCIGALLIGIIPVIMGARGCSWINNHSHNDSSTGIIASGSSGGDGELLPPSYLTAIPLSHNQVQLDWEDNSDNEEGFMVYRTSYGEGGICGCGCYCMAQRCDANVTSTTVSYLLPETIYYFIVRAYSASGYSFFSNEAEATTLDDGAPAAAANLSVGRVSDSLIDLSWSDEANNELGFKIERKLEPGGTYEQIGTVEVNITSYSDSGLNTRPGYYYRVLAYNTAGDSTYSNEAGATTQASDTWLAASGPPAGRGIHTAIWTGTSVTPTLNNKMLIWGGFYMDMFQETDVYCNTGGIYDPDTGTWKTMTTDNAPSGRMLHTAVWTGSRMIVWGGTESDEGPLVNTGRIYDPALDLWTDITTDDAPFARVFHTAVWTGSGPEAWRNKMIVWGGDSGEGYFNDGGIYDPLLNTWTEITTTGAPDGRIYHTAVWTGSKIIVWGGDWGDGYLNTGGVYDPALDLWTDITTTNAPIGRADHTAVWTGSQMIVWGGSDSQGGGLNCGGVYDPNTDTWDTTKTNLIEGNNAPAGRSYHTAVWSGSYLVVWGGDVPGDSPVNSGGRYDLVADTWTATNDEDPDVPPERFGHTAVWTGSNMIVWGGFDPENFWFYDNGARYDPVGDDWTPILSFEPRADHTAVWTGSEMIVWGGYYEDLRLGPCYSNTGWRYNPAMDSWTLMSVTNAPIGRYGHKAVWTGSEMIVWGGMKYIGEGEEPVNTGGVYDPVADTWTEMSTIDAPIPRAFHTAIWTGSKMLVWGGDCDGEYLNCGGVYDPELNSWTPITTTDAPDFRAFHTAVWTGSKMIVWGGEASGGGYLNCGGVYDPVLDTWTAMTTTGAPDSRAYHTAVWTGTHMIVWGGVIYGYTNNGGIYDPNTDTWDSETGLIEGLDAPEPRAYHTAVWTGSQMIVWGGDYGESPLASGGIYDPLEDAWSTTSEDDPYLPIERLAHSAVWTGTKMIIWGGYADDYFLNTGGFYVPGFMPFLD